LAQARPVSIPNLTLRTALTLMAMSFLLTACDSRGADLRQQLTGTWSQGAHTLTLAPDGTYTSLFPGKPPVTYKARWHVEHGFLMVTDVKSNSVPIHGNTTLKIIMVDNHHLVLALGTNGISMTR
jgi:hypothetical protein